MPTASRRQCTPGAISQVLEQDWRVAGLGIPADGDEPVADLIPRRRSIRHLRKPRQPTRSAVRYGRWLPIKTNGDE
jgi:hypothetical protein